MARARNIKPAFFMNEKLGELDALNRLLFIGLWCLADREGRLECRPLRIKANLFPYDSCDVRDMLNKLHSLDFVKIYKVNDEEYIQINKWAKHQNPHHKEVASVIPSPENHKNTVCDGYIPLSNTIRNRIYDRDGRVCLCCETTEDLSIDHIVPVSKHGNSVDDNLQVLCKQCNAKKSDLTINFKKLDKDALRLIREQFKHGLSMTQAQVNKIACYPTDSLNLIPDSLNLIPSSATPVAEPVKEPKWSALTCDLPEGINVEAWRRWAHARSSRKKPISELAAKEQWKTLIEHSKDVQGEMIKSSIANDYQGIFPPKSVKTPDNASFIDRHTDRSWRDGLGRSAGESTIEGDL